MNEPRTDDSVVYSDALMRLIFLKMMDLQITTVLSEWGYSPITAHDLAELRADVDYSQPMLLVGDAGDASDLVQALRQCAGQAATRPVRTLAIARRDVPGSVDAALSAGVDDVVSWPTDVAELRQRIALARHVLELGQSLVLARAQAQRQALYDSLSGLLNHGAIVDLLERELKRSRREGWSVGVAIADIDQFKCINDKHGHLAGDAAIMAVSGRLLSQVRQYDYVGRYGGDEFLVVLSKCNAEQAKVVCHRVLNNISSIPIQTMAGSLQISVSIGVALPESGGEPDANHLIHMADIALYEAKRAGRNRVVMSGETHALPGLL